MPSKKVQFLNSDGVKLSAKIDLPLSRSPFPFALFAHVFTGNKNLTSARHISRELTQHGIGVMRFDFTGLGESEGNFSETNFTSNISDLESAAAYLAEHYESPSIIIGHSLGGAAALFASQKIDSISAVVTIGSPSYPEHVTHLLSDNIETIEKNGCAIVNVGGREFTIKKQFLDDLRSQNHTDIIKNLGKGLLVMHSPQDMVVGIDNAANIYSLAKHPKSFVTLDGADHMLTHKDDAKYAGTVISSWVRRYVKFPEELQLKTDKDVVVRLEDEDIYTTDILAGSHSMIADEPDSIGGHNFGPSPYELLNSSLGACTAMTLQMYARRKGWDLQEVKVHLSHAKTNIHQDDMQDVDKKSGRIDRFEKVLELVGDLDEEQKRRLLQIASKCPVHRTLAGRQEFATKLVEDQDWTIY
jgi:putative redox protein